MVAGRVRGSRMRCSHRSGPPSIRRPPDPERSSICAALPSTPGSRTRRVRPPGLRHAAERGSRCECPRRQVRPPGTFVTVVQPRAEYEVCFGDPTAVLPNRIPRNDARPMRASCTVRRGVAALIGSTTGLFARAGRHNVRSRTFRPSIPYDRDRRRTQREGGRDRRRPRRPR
jgi:hypothetical protein